MIKKFLGEVRVGLLSILQPRLPAWTTAWYWLDRLQERRDQNGPRRPVSRFRIVRYLKGVAHSLGLFGWLWAGVAVFGLLWLTKGAGFGTYLVTVGTALASLKAGAIWTRRNTVFQIEWEDECPCRQWEEDL